MLEQLYESNFQVISKDEKDYGEFRVIYELHEL